jgi:hypothetical protein
VRALNPTSLEERDWDALRRAVRHTVWVFAQRIRHGNYEVGELKSHLSYPCSSIVGENEVRLGRMNQK